MVKPLSLKSVFSNVVLIIVLDLTDVITELPIADDAPAPSLALDESWIVAQGPSLPTLPVLMAPGPKRWQRNQQPKGTKPRRVRSSGLRRPSAAALIVAPVDDDDTDDSASLSSSIAVIPAPEMPRSVETITASVSPSTILSASSASAKQAAAISSSKLVSKLVISHVKLSCRTPGLSKLVMNLCLSYGDMQELLR